MKTTKTMNLLKLCVGINTVEELEEWQRERRKSGVYTSPEHVTRFRPRRYDEVLNGGSLYWVINGAIAARQRVIAFDQRIDPEGIKRWAIVFDDRIVRTEPVPKRPFQGWRYLTPKKSPLDLPFQGQTGSFENVRRLFEKYPYEEFKITIEPYPR
ncbi:MAG: DUF1489 family protein [Rhodobacteraceae bacterium]|nr:DUF1489 family protein [Paracoccaceae bacterium]